MMQLTGSASFWLRPFLDSPIRNDYIRLASVSVDGALQRHSELSMRMEEGKTPGGPPRALDDYTI